MSDGYSLRSRDANKSKTASPSPRRHKLSPGHFDRSGFSSSSRSKGQDSLLDEDDNDDDLLNLTDDVADLSYPSTTASPTAETPSPRYRKHRGQESCYMTPPSRLYPDLSDVSLDEERKNDTLKDKKNDDDKGNIVPHSVGNALVVVCMVLVLYYFITSPCKVPARMSKFQSFVADVDALQTEFRSQERRTWKTIKSSIKHILNSTAESQYPAVVLFAVNSKYISVASCLARRVASLFNSQRDIPGEDGYLDVRPFRHSAPKDQKKILEQRIALNFDIGFSVVIDQLGDLSPSASLLLHGTCDDSNAPFKDVFIGILFSVDTDLTSDEVDSKLQKYFEKELDADKIGALLSRISNNAVVVKKEDLSTIEC